MAAMGMDAREVAKGQVKAQVALPPAVRPSEEAAELRRAARARQLVVARWLRHLSASQR